MKYIICIAIAICVIFISCNDIPETTASKTKNKSVIDFKNYTGNAIIFFSEDPGLGTLIFIIPVLEKDSIKFNNANVLSSIKGQSSLQTRITHGAFMELINNENKKIFFDKVCNLPHLSADTLYYLRAFISYKNYTEIYKEQVIKDSCDTHVIIASDSSEINAWNIYK